MKTLSSDFTTQKNLFLGSELRTLLEIVTSGGTLYYSDQDLVAGSQAYSARVLEYGRIQTEVSPGEDYIRQGSVSIKLSNNPRIDTDIQPGDNVTIYYVYDDQGASDKLKIFEGTVTNDIEWDYYSFFFSVKDISDWYDKVIGEKLTPAAYPDADPDDWNKIKPIIYGEFENHPCLWIDAGAATTLDSDHNDSVTTLNVTDTTRFPSSGNVWIGDEKISYTGKTSVTFTGCTRGAGGTTATTHSRADAVLGDAASVKALVAGHVLRAVDKVMILPWGAKTSDAVTIDPADYTVTLDDSGVATITLTDLPNIRKKVAIAVTQQPNQPVTSEGSHNHTASLSGVSQVTLYGSSIANQINATNPGNTCDQNLDVSYCDIYDNTYICNGYVGLNFSVGSYDGLQIIEATCCVKHTCISGPGMNSYRLKANGYSENFDLDQTGVGVIQKFNIADLEDDTDWSNLQNLQFYMEDGSSPVHAYCYEIWWEIKFLPAVSISNHAASSISTSPRTTDAAIGGDSVADTLGGTLICNGQGYKDDGSGHYTGVANALIEEPWDVFHHILETYSNGPVAHADIDLAGSFADAASNLPPSYKFAFTITHQVKLNELLTLLAKQTWCRFVWEAGTARLNRIKTSGSSDKSLDTDEDSLLVNDQLAVKIEQWGLDRICNDVTVLYDLDRTLSYGDWGNTEAYQANSQDDDATSISAYGRRARTFHCFAIGDNSMMADDLRGKLLVFYKDARQIFSFPSLMRNIELERGDMLDITCSQLGLSANLAEVIAVDYDLPVPLQERGPMVWFTLLAG